jgi:hypothetical protein
MRHFWRPVQEKEQSQQPFDLSLLIFQIILALELVPNAKTKKGCVGRLSYDITKDAGFYTATARFVAWLGAFTQERQGLWFPKDDLKDSSTWSSPRFCSTVTSTPSFLPNMTVRRAVRRLSHRLM